MAETEFTTQNLEYAVSVFYNGEHAERAKAHNWLTAAQRIPEAWMFVWELLQPNKGTEIQFYAATTLHTKILRCWNELPTESYEELKEKILHAILTYSNGPKIVTNRLCISLAAFILQQGAVDLVAVLRPLSTLENTSLLLEVLTVIPEEFNSMTMGSILRAKNRASLSLACPAVLDDMLRYLQTVFSEYTSEGPGEATVQAWQAAAACASSWLAMSGEDGALPERLPLCRALLGAVRVLFLWNEAVSDTALEASEACLAAVRAAAGGGGAARYPLAAMQLIEELTQLAALVMRRDDVPNSINEELLAALITCCVCLCECHANAVVENAQTQGEWQEAAKRLIEVLLAAQGAPGHYPLHETRSNLVFGAWYTLQDEILNGTESGSAPLWRDVFSRLLSALVAKSEAHESALTKDELELLRCYRQDVADTVMYCYAILGEWCWATVEAAYAAAGGEARREAVLHVFLALADAAPPRRAPAPLLNMLQRAVDVVNTARDKRTLNTALDCLGSYATWLGSERGAPDPRVEALGRECLAAAGGALQRAPPAAALALRRLCSEHSAPAAARVSDIVHAAMSPASRADTWVRRQLLSAAGAALAAAELDVATPLLQELAASLRRDLEEQAAGAASGAASAGGGAGGGAGAAECCAALLGALAARPAHAELLLRAALPPLPAFAAAPPLVEPMFGILKQAVSTLMDACLPLMAEIAQLTVAAFNTRPCAPGLDVLKLIVLVVGNEWAHTGQLLHACVATAAVCVTRDPVASPDLTEGLFLLLQTLTKKKPQYIDWIEDLLSQLVELCVTCMLVWEGGVMRAACGWGAALASQRPAALQPRAPALTVAALRCLGGAVPRNHVGPVAELLQALGRARWLAGADAEAGAEAGAGAGGELGAWLRLALAAPAFPTPHATDQHKQKFIAAVLKERCSTNKRRLLESVQEFSLVCRGLLGTEYARQTLASRQLIA